MDVNVNGAVSANGAKAEFGDSIPIAVNPTGPSRRRRLCALKFRGASAGSGP